MNPHGRSGVDRFLSVVFGLWSAATTAFVVVNAALLALKGSGVFLALVQVGPVSGLKLTYAALGLVWMSGGLLVAFLLNPGFRSRQGLLAVGCFLTLALYANVLRERMEYPDAGDYMRAAFDLAQGQPLHERYIYPPLLAAALELLVPLGRGGMRVALWTSNVLAVAVFPVLLALALVKYGFERRVATLLALGFVLVNVPVLRTLVYGQVNLHVANLILLALLLYPRLPVGSALALALAVHLKTSPIVLVLPFVTGRSWRWLAAFAAWMAAVAGAIYAAHGAQPFVDFVHNTRGVYQWSDLSFRENSIDSLLRNTSALLGGAFAFLGAPVVRRLALGVVVLATLAVAFAAIGRGAWAKGRGALSDVLNGWPALSLLMVLASPLVWEHHPVFVALPFLVITKRLQSPMEWALWTLAYGVVYLLPTFDFYPWSFGRLAGQLLLVALLYRSSHRSEDGDAFRVAQQRLGVRTS